MPSPLSRSMTHVSLPSLLRIPWPVRAARRSRSPSSLRLQERPNADLLLWKHGLCHFCDCCFYLANFMTVNTTEQEREGERGHDWWKLMGGYWASTLGLALSWALDPVYFKLDTLFHVSWKSVLPLVSRAGWLIRGFSLWGVWQQNVSIRESLWDGAAGTL